MPGCRLVVLGSLLNSCWIGGGWCQTNAAGDDVGWESRPRLEGERTAQSGGIPGQGIHNVSAEQRRGTVCHEARRPVIAQPGTHGAGQGVHGNPPKELKQKMPTQAEGSGKGVHGNPPPEPRPFLSHDGNGVHADSDGGPLGHGATSHVSDFAAGGRPQLADAYSRGRGVHDDNHLSQQRPYIAQLNNGGSGLGVHSGENDHKTGGTCAQRRAWLVAWFSRLRDRLRTVRVCCGDFLRVMDSESVTTRLGVTGIFADPPYPSHHADGTQSRDPGLYAQDSSPDKIRDRLLTYCLERGDNPLMRICVAGYDTDGYAVLEKHGWEVVAWKSQGGYANRRKSNQNRTRERLWFSPHCRRETSLFDGLEG